MLSRISLVTAKKYILMGPLMNKKCEKLTMFVARFESLYVSGNMPTYPPQT